MMADLALILLLYLAVGLSVAGRKSLLVSITSIPAIYIGYFLISIFVFSFGEDMPYTYYQESQKTSYLNVAGAISVHFLAVFLAFVVISPFDRWNRAAATSSYYVDGLKPLLRFRLKLPGALVCLLPTAFIFMSAPISDLWQRDGYILEAAQHGWMRFADITFLLSALMTPFIRNQVLKYATLMGVMLPFMGLGSRSAVVMLIVFTALDRFAIGNRNILKHLLLLLFALYLLALTLYMRSQSAGGLLPMLVAGFSVNPEVMFANLVFGMNYMFNLSFILIGELFATVQTESRWFFYSISPLPSFIVDMTDDFDAANRFRANIPYSGFGYAFKHLGAITYFALTFCAAICFLCLRSLFSTRRDILEKILCFAFFVFPFLLLLQYNLRSGFRMIYVLGGAYFAIAILRRLRFTKIR